MTLVFSKLSKTQVFATGDQTERSYGCQISIADPKQSILQRIFTSVMPVI